ncbi:endonuclease [Nocardioides sp. HDW12B]|uniref:endonuclease n=1 Tax=Nocardioides sp. HDW12B TaxID=2714939 RepID=UPI0019825801|nr:endonuclease [Nocardioides sp. HDW12B]
MAAVRNECGKPTSAGFEPVHGKGAAARASFYFRIRYPGHISEEELSSTGWEVLLAWHEQEPVSQWELHRNAAIFERQGNRNPFIDHPLVGARRTAADPLGPLILRPSWGMRWW